MLIYTVYSQYEDVWAKLTVDWIKNEFEQYVYSLKNQVAGEGEGKLGDKLDDEEKSTINDGIESAIEWLDENGEGNFIFFFVRS